MRWGRDRCRRSTTSRSCPVTKFAATPESTAEIPGLLDEALTAALRPHSGPAFVDFPLDVVFSEAAEEDETATLPDPAAGEVPDVAAAAALQREAERR